MRLVVGRARGPGVEVLRVWRGRGRGRGVARGLGS